MYFPILDLYAHLFEEKERKNLDYREFPLLVKNAAAFVTFAVSGFMHEIILASVTDSFTFQWTSFFIVHVRRRECVFVCIREREMNEDMIVCISMRECVRE